MYKVKNPYKGSIMELNMMGVGEYRRTKFSGAEIMVFAAPFLTVAALVVATAIPEMSFMAECQNIPGGDICSITLK